MADDNFRSYRSRDPLLRNEAASDPSDPLAELARLIGQSGPYPDSRRPEAYSPAQADDEVEAPTDEWTADADYADEPAEEPYDPSLTAPQSPASYQSSPTPDRAYESEPPPGGRYFSGSAAEFGGFREEPAAEYRNDHVPALRPREVPAYATAETEEDYADEQPQEGGESYASDDYYDEPPAPRRRGAVVVVMAVLSLAVIGTAGAFGYRTMFGGSMLPMLPPIIKASNGPIKIAPSYGDQQAGNTGQPPSAKVGSTENLVSREEQPVNVEAPKAPPRVVASIPVVGAQTPPPPPLPAPAAPSAAAPSPWPPPPPMPTAAPAPNPTPPPAQISTEPKRIHTVTIRPDQAPAPDAAPLPQAPPPAAAARATTRPAPTPPKPVAVSSPPPAGSNAPLSIVPGGQGEAPAPAVRTRVAAAPVAVASAAPVARAPEAPSAGGYAVQITSQRSEAEAQASFRELRAKYPNQLNGREPIIRRADLGAKGTYYRALVGPFASAERAAEMCSGLKAAGGNCLVQKN